MLKKDMLCMTCGTCLVIATMAFFLIGMHFFEGVVQYIVVVSSIALGILGCSCLTVAHEIKRE